MVFVGDISIVFMGFINQFITFGGHHQTYRLYPQGPVLQLARVIRSKVCLRLCETAGA